MLEYTAVIPQKINVLDIVEVAEYAGKAVMEVYNSGDMGVQEKEDQSPLTKADLASNRIICAGLARLCPHIPIISEENRQMPYDIRKKYEYVFIVDPLDGTKEFVKKNGQFTIMIGLVHGSRPVLGVVHTPAEGKTHYAVQGLGAYVREAGKPESVTKIQCRPFDRTQEGLTVVASASHADATTHAFITQFREPKLVNLGSSLKMNLIAEGKADVYPRFAPTSEWDVCAADIIVSEAGGRIIQADRSGEGKPGWLERMAKSGQPLQYNKENMLNPDFLVLGKFDLEQSIKQLESQGVDISKPLEEPAPEGQQQGGYDCSVM